LWRLLENILLNLKDNHCIIFSNAPIEESDEEKPGVILDYDKDGNIVGLEILDASRRAIRNLASLGLLTVKPSKELPVQEEIFV